MTRLLAAWILVCVSGRGAEEFFRVSGVVVDGVSGQPLARVRVGLAPLTGRDREIASTTGADGRFQFAGVERGKYQLYAERAGYLTHRYGTSPVAGGHSVPVVTGPGLDTTRLTFRLWPPGVIRGRVVDDAGEPVAGARVQLLRRQVYAGRARVTTLRWALTDELGEYRLPYLPAGSYYLAVTGTPWYAGAPGEIGLMSFAPRFYPDTPDSASATPLVLKAGQEANADFTMMPARGGQVRIRVSGFGPWRTRVTLAREGILGNECFLGVKDTLNSEVLFTGVPPGRYTARAACDADGGAMMDERTVEVGGGEASVSLTVRQLPPIKGVLRAPPGVLGRQSLVVHLRDDEGRLGLARAVESTGAFTIPGMLPGKYRVSVTSGEDVRYLESVVANGRAQTGTLVEIPSSGNLKLELTLGAGAGKVAGQVFEKDAPAVGVLVVLAPRNQSAGPDAYQALVSESDGSYHFDEVPPGDYSLFATPDTSIEYANRAAISAFLPAAQTVRVAPNSTQALRVNLP